LTLRSVTFNTGAYDALKTKDSPVDADVEQMATLAQQIRATIPVLTKVGMFDFVLGGGMV